MHIIIKYKMKKLIFKLGSALLLSVVVSSCTHEYEDFENSKAELKLVNEKFSAKNEANYERQQQPDTARQQNPYIARQQSDSISFGRSEQTAEKDLIETVDPDKIKPPQH